MPQSFFLYALLLFSICSIRLPAQIDTFYICDQGESVNVNVEPGFYAYRWLPDHGLNNPTIANPTATLFSNQTYVTEIITDVIGENLIENPDFSAGNEGFESEYIFVRSIFIQGVYGISTSAFDLNESYFSDCPDKTTGSGDMMVIDGSPQSDVNVWCQIVDVQPATDYAFSVWLTSVHPSNPAILQFSINDEQLGLPFRAGWEVCDWRRFYEIWHSNEATTAEICIVNQNTNPEGNDFALDDFAFQELAAIRYDTTVVIVEAIAAAKERRVYVPTAFSPNYDGKNDKFQPYFGKGVRLVESFQIFDRWGNEVFGKSDCSINDPDLAWDGRVKGEWANSGTYVYRAKVLFSDQQTEVIKGEVQLVR
ncbi:MAG: gliding motility-associated C-terminal domain-containing protein [Saprospiraceae bacterium]